MPTPSAEERARLHEAILVHVAKTQRDRTILEDLFAHHDVEGRRAADLVALFARPRPSEAVIRAHISRLNKRIRRFFKGKGRIFVQHVEIDEYRLRFPRNVEAETPEHFRTEFWSHYFSSDKPVRVLYPEPEFFIDERLTYFRNPASIESDVSEAFGYLNAAGNLERAYSFVPSGIVRALLYLSEMFQEQHVPVHATPVWPFTPGNHDPEGDVIILGTPTTSSITVTLEERRAARTTSEGIEIGGALKYRDAHQEDTTGEKWGLVTRREHRFAGRLITVISAKHGRTIQAIAQFLTRHDDMERLAQHVRDVGGVARELQMVFRVNMSKGAGEPRIDGVELVELL
jgi:hypothetical protein